MLTEFLSNSEPGYFKLHQETITTHDKILNQATGSYITKL